MNLVFSTQQQRAVEGLVGGGPEQAIGFQPGSEPQDNKAATYVRLFEMNGYEVAADESVEDGYKKIALYILDGNFQHAARQLSATKWTSKIGKHEDIRHELRALERDGPHGYGVAIIFMRKSKA